MLIKFIPTKKSSTLVDAVLSYIFQSSDSSGNPRSVVKQVAGTMPQILSFLALSIPSKTPYTHSTLNFSESDMARTTEADRLHILYSYIDELSAGLGDRKRLPFLAVSHGDHYHVVTLRWDLLSEKVYQPFVVTRGDTQRFNVWKDLVNTKYGLDAPGETQTFFRLDGKHARNGVRELVHALNGTTDGLLNKPEPKELIKALEPLIHDHGYEVARVTRSGFSVTAPGMKRNVRIKFTSRAMGKAVRVGKGNEKQLNERLARHRRKLMAHMTRYHVSDADAQFTFQRHCMDREMSNGIHHFSAMA